MTTLEKEARVRELIQQIFQEQREELRREIREEELGALRQEIEVQISRVWEAIGALTERVDALVTAQQRTEERLEQLAEAQQRTEERLEQLAEAQRGIEERMARLEEAQIRTEERLERLEATVQQLAEAQRRTTENLERLRQYTDERIKQLEQQLGHIVNILGVDVEADAQDTVVYILRQKGYRLLGPPYALALNGEVDVIARVETPEGKQVWVLVEAKTRARLRELRRWAEQLRDRDFLQRLAEAGIDKPYLPYLFGLRVYQIVDEEASKLGIGVLDPDGERVAPRLLQ